jgi:hypothetical protein
MHDPSYVVVREHLLGSFDRFWVDNLHGDRKISEYAPDGRTSETVFALAGFSPGIQPGVAVSLWVKKGKSDGRPPVVLFRDDLNAAGATERRQQLVASLVTDDFDGQYRAAVPTEQNHFLFRPLSLHPSYYEWPLIVDLALVPPLLGLNDNRGQGTHDIDRAMIETRMRSYYDPSFTDAQIAELHRGLMTDAAGYTASTTRVRLLKQSAFNEKNVVRFWFKPFDLRWAYIERKGNLWNRSRPELLDQNWEGNEFILTRRHAPKAPDGAACFYSRHISDQHVLHTDAYFLPIWIREAQPKKNSDQMEIAGATELSESVPNLIYRGKTLPDRSWVP